MTKIFYMLAQKMIEDFNKRVEEYNEENVLLSDEKIIGLSRKIIIYLEDYRYKITEKQVNDFVLERITPEIKGFIKRETEDFINKIYIVINNFTQSLKETTTKENLDNNMKNTLNGFKTIEEEKDKFEDLIVELNYLVEKTRSISEIGSEAPRLYNAAIEKTIVSLFEEYKNNKNKFLKNIWDEIEILYEESRKRFSIISEINPESEPEQSSPSPFL